MKSLTTILITLLICIVFTSPSFADPIEDAKTAVTNQDFTKAHEILAPLAEQDNLEALSILGAMYVNGQGVETDQTKGLALITKAASKGYEPAKVTAINLNIELANKGDIAAMFNVGYMCFNGWGGAIDTGVCLKWLENAGEIGHEKSTKILTKIYTEGMFGVTPDATKATYWKETEAAIAAGIEGSWEGSLPPMGGPTPMPMEVTYKFKKEGDVLSGVYINKGFGNKKSLIKEGKIDGTNFSFSIESNFMGKQMTTNYTGVFYGKTIKLTYTMPAGPDGAIPPPVTLIAKRAE
jgi:Sel1 repeat